MLVSPRIPRPGSPPVPVLTHSPTHPPRPITAPPALCTQESSVAAGGSDVRERSIAQASDKEAGFDKAALPAIMQVRHGFGMKGKYELG